MEFFKFFNEFVFKNNFPYFGRAIFKFVSRFSKNLFIKFKLFVYRVFNKYGTLL